MICETCKNLRNILARERQVVARLKGRNKALSQGKRDRQILVDQGAANQIDVHKAVRFAVGDVLDLIGKKEEYTAYIRKRRSAFLNMAIKSLDGHEKVWVKNPPRRAAEHSMGRGSR